MNSKRYERHMARAKMAGVALKLLSQYRKYGLPEKDKREFLHPEAYKELDRLITIIEKRKAHHAHMANTPPKPRKSKPVDPITYSVGLDGVAKKRKGRK